MRYTEEGSHSWNDFIILEENNKRLEENNKKLVEEVAKLKTIIENLTKFTPTQENKKVTITLPTKNRFNALAHEEEDYKK